MSHETDIPIIGGDAQLVDALLADIAETENGMTAASTTVPRTTPRRSHAEFEQARKNTRYTVKYPVTCYAILPSLEVDINRRLAGVIEDVSETGIGLNVVSNSVRPGDHLLLSVDTGEKLQFTDVNVLQISGGGSATRLHTSLSGPLENIFAEDFLLPYLDEDRYQYTLPVSDSVLRSLGMLGAVQRVVMDELMVCPDCLAVPTIRRGCSLCLSHDTQKSLMIHHFACANVDFVDRFDQGGEIICPKCRGRKMIIGADFEYLDGPVECRECGHDDMEEILVGHCLKCSNRFPLEKADTIEIAGYRVNRLDPLALVH